MVPRGRLTVALMVSLSNHEGLARDIGMTSRTPTRQVVF
jgi:hypothetical protein